MPTLPFKLNQAGRHHIPRQKHKVTNWPAYDASLRQRGSLTVWFTDDAITAWEAEPRTTRGGQPWHRAGPMLRWPLFLNSITRLVPIRRRVEGISNARVHGHRGVPHFRSTATWPNQKRFAPVKRVSTSCDILPKLIGF